jgi:hypothetical protein
MSNRYENGPPGYPYDHVDHGFYGRRAKVAVQHASDYASPYLRTRRLGAASVGATAVGALAVGAFAIGALAISRLAINRMGMRQGHIQSLTIDELRVRRLRIDRQDGPDATPRYAAMRRA